MSTGLWLKDAGYPRGKMGTFECPFSLSGGFCHAGAGFSCKGKIVLTSAPGGIV